MANEKLTLLKHLELLAVRSAAMITSKVAELATSVTDALEEMDAAKQDKINSPADIGAAASSHTHDGYVPTTRKVNSKALSADVTLTASDVGAAASSHGHAASDITSGVLAAARGGTGVTSLAGTSGLAHAMFPSNVTFTYGSIPILGPGWDNNGYASTAQLLTMIGGVPTTRTINGKALSSNITLSASDLGCAPSYQYSTTDLTAGSSALATGTLYFVYE